MHVSKFSRYLFIALMLVLLPMPGWASNIMAIDMAKVVIVQASMTDQTAMPADCVMHTQALVEDTTSLCGSCDACELCLSVANLSYTTWLGQEAVRHASPPAPSTNFSSPFQAIRQKTPIS